MVLTYQYIPVLTSTVCQEVMVPLSPLIDDNCTQHCKGEADSIKVGKEDGYLTVNTD